jgi:hypothetical protein
MMSKSHGSSEKKKRGEFFAIDRRIWGEICNLGRMNEPVAYLVMAQGTGGDNRSTSWSTTSLKKHAGISWDRGKPAVQCLIEHGFIRYSENHSTSKPRYELSSWAEFVASAEASHERKTTSLSNYNRLLVNDVRNNQLGRMSKGKREDLKRLVEFGILSQHGSYDHYTVSKCPFVTADPDLIWLPNTIITGTNKREPSPICRLRSAGDVWALRLLIDLYHAHNLSDNGGISPWVIRENYESKLVGEQEIFKVWAFKRANGTFWWEGPFGPHLKRPKSENQDSPAWESVRWLQNQGLLTFVPHLWENDSKQAEVLHSYGIRGIGGEPIEIEIANAAYATALSMVPSAKSAAAMREGYSYFAPVQSALPKVQMIGVARLTYRPRTRKTSDWYAELHKSAKAWITAYQNMGEKPGKVMQESA